MLNDSTLHDERTWNYPSDYDPPKPLRASQISRLGDILDEVETEPHWSVARSDAELDYLLAVRDRVWFQIKKLQAMKRAPSWRAGQQLKSEITEAQRQLDRADTARQLCDARAALQLARRKFEIAERKYQQSRRQAKADDRSGKNLVTLRGITFRRSR